MNHAATLPNGVSVLPDGSGCCVVAVDSRIPPLPPVRWNPFNKVVCDHRDGTIDRDLTDEERAKRGLPVPWTPLLAEREVHEAPVY